jgi:gamma-glutamylcysteine synthetase
MTYIKINQLRDVILTLADNAHRDRINDLLNALEQEVGYATLDYAERCVRVRADDARTAHSNPVAGEYAAMLLAHAADSLKYADWERRIIENQHAQV